MNPSLEDRRPALRPPQFGLSTLFSVVGALCAVLAAMKFIGPIGAFALVLFLLSVLAHVSGNAIGIRLRSNGDQPLDEKDRPVGKARGLYKLGFKPAGPKRLTERRRMGIVFAAVVVVAVALSAGGGAWWTLRAGPHAPPLQDILLAAAAFGVLGGIWGLVIAGFVVVGVGAWREALKGAGRSEPPK